MKMSKDNIFPEIISDLPEAEIPIEGIHSRLFQGENKQFIFMAFEKDVKISNHSHEAQWGVVLDGEIELTIEDKIYIFKKGDSYFIPKGAKHRAMIKKGYKDLTLFNQKNRYKTK
jgi:quercetin dioxygenase-like cupin family protein